MQIENLFHLQVIVEEGDTQLNLKWVNLDEKRNRKDYCEGCKTIELRKRVVGLVENLVGVKQEVADKPVVQKSQEGVLFKRLENGEWGWFKKGNEKTDIKYVGEIKNNIPKGQGYLTTPKGSKYEGGFKDGHLSGQGTMTFFYGKKVKGE